jgi:hypothetical protein
MRPYAFALTLSAAVAIAPAAFAQPMGVGLGAPQTIEENPRVGPLKKLPKPVQDWMAEESVRQAKSPGDLDALDEDMQSALGAALDKAAQRNRLSQTDIVSAIRYCVVRQAGQLLDNDLNLRRKLAGETPSDDEMLTIEAVTTNRIRVRALEEQAKRRLTLKAAAFID